MDVEILREPKVARRKSFAPSFRGRSFASKSQTARHTCKGLPASPRRQLASSGSRLGEIAWESRRQPAQPHFHASATLHSLGLRRWHQGRTVALAVAGEVQTLPRNIFRPVCPFGNLAFPQLEIIVNTSFARGGSCHYWITKRGPLCASSTFLTLLSPIHSRDPSTTLFLLTNPSSLYSSSINLL